MENNQKTFKECFLALKTDLEKLDTEHQHSKSLKQLENYLNKNHLTDDELKIQIAKDVQEHDHTQDLEKFSALLSKECTIHLNDILTMSQKNTEAKITTSTEGTTTQEETLAGEHLDTEL